MRKLLLSIIGIPISLLALVFDIIILPFYLLTMGLVYIIEFVDYLKTGTFHHLIPINNIFCFRQIVKYFFNL